MNQFELISTTQNNGNILIRLSYYLLDDWDLSY
jgi:hypothetical protein